MLSKEQINRLDELAAKATPGPWFKNHRGAIGPRSTEEDQSYGMVIPVAFADVIDSDGSEIRNAEFIAAANPQAVSELIAMLRESQKELSFQIAEHQREYDLRIEAQKDAARYRHWRDKTILETHKFLSADDCDKVIDKSMQRDCDGVQHAKDSE